MTSKHAPVVLTEADRAALASGRHTEVAADLLSRGHASAAAWVYEQIWDWDAAWAAYHQAQAPVEALRVALESGSVVHLDRSLGEIERQPGHAAAAIALLKKRRRPLEAARLQALQDDPRARAQSLIEGGDRLGAARLLADHGHAQEALEQLKHASPGATTWAMTARLAWDLGDAEGAARAAQKSLRSLDEGADRSATQDLLARALVALGHDLAAQIVLRGRVLDLQDLGLPGRYEVQGVGPPGLVGAAYIGIDRLTLEEVEIHLLLADHSEGGPVEPGLLAALERFQRTAQAAARIGHPAIRPIRRIDAHAGLLVLPRAEGPPLRTLIRAPGMIGMLSRVRGLVVFLLEALEAAHPRGLVHRGILPTHIPSHNPGRPILGPGGADNLAGLAATRTGSLEEILFTTAPEVRAGAAPHVGSDVYAVGSIFFALLAGHLEAPPTPLSPPWNTLPEVQLAVRMRAADPSDRPSVEAALAVLRSPVADIRELEMPGPHPSRSGALADAPEHGGTVGPGLAVTVATTWPDPLIDALCRNATPFMQTILDRSDRTLFLAPWPPGSRTLGEAIDQWQTLLPSETWAVDDAALEAALAERLQPSSMVRTPCGQWMLALDDVLTR